MPSTPPIGVEVGEPNPELLALTLFAQAVGILFAVAFWCDWRWYWERARQIRIASSRRG